MAKLVGCGVEKDNKGKPAFILARLPIEEGAKTAKGQPRYYSSGGFTKVEGTDIENLTVSCTIFKGKK